MTSDDTYRKLTTLLDERGAAYRVMEHPPEGNTEAVSLHAGYDQRQAAKCIVVMVKVGKKETRYAAIVLPGPKRVDFAKVKALFGGTYASFAPREVAEELAGCPVGSIPPFSFDERLTLVVDPEVLQHPEVFFNAARLDRSIGLATKDYEMIAQPQVEAISQT
ncbi:YbaK/EbsC family protein [Saccharothrix syringae]|uniref:YbaK/prolyl-tRNA synthetase associated domain-containing protein n=1 Tax=Saccharothrix syringae TaxID=103733 RepID=A0A5Q0H544_SACSY|nr:YbaK/EbsC family protein [Saccharothrix syringae]QFZ21368.1 YbaK/prolyl-tRNA synthetase associated domain-containing protein [Saccharothrix syringae]